MVIQSSTLDKESRNRTWRVTGENSEVGSGCRADLVFYPLWI